MQTCGIVIAETDYLKKVICQKCGSFVNKMWEFRQQTQEVQLTLRQQFSVKRGIATSPASCKQPEKCNAFVSNDDNNWHQQNSNRIASDRIHKTRNGPDLQNLES